MLLRHATFNLIGLGAPLLVAVVSIPPLISTLGPERFGLLTLIWAIVSYFGLFDLGLGRALTQQLALVLAGKHHERSGPLMATATVLMLGLGIIAGVVMFSAAAWAVGMIREVPDRQEAIHAVQVVAMAMPAIVLTSGFRGALEARHAFGTINLIRVPMGLFTFLGPLAVAIYGEPRLDWIAAVLAGGRVVGCAVHAWCAWRVLPSEHGSLEWKSELVGPLCVSGGWLTVSNIVGPLMAYLDRFVIGAIVSASAIAYYATPQELALKLWIVPGALTAVLFPTFAAQMARGDDQTWALFTKAVRWLVLAMLPITVSLALFADDLLSAWISPQFAQEAAPLLQIFAIGMFISSVAQVPYTVIQSAGRAKITALIHCAELPLFLAALWLLTSTYGAAGAACAWLLRAAADAVLMLLAGSAVLGQPPRWMLDAKVLVATALAIISFSGALLPEGLPRVLWMALVAIGIGWSFKKTIVGRQAISGT